MASLGQRMMGAARLDAGTYEEVEADATATGQAALVVVISSICIAIGSREGVGVVGLILVAIFRLIAWYVWAFVTYLVGTKLLAGPRTEADVGQMLRTIGFASAPGIVALLGAIPWLTGTVSLIVSLWLLVAMIVAVRQALDYDTTGRAIAVVLIGFVAYLVVAVLLVGLIAGVEQT
jgi:hypothetical protein